MANPNIVNVATINGKTDSGELNTTYTTRPSYKRAQAQVLCIK